MNTWFVSDTHFGHTNIIKYCNRPFSNVEEMDYNLINNWNSKVAPEDTVWHLGDFALTTRDKAQSIFNRLNGVKHFIVGNHDKVGIVLDGWSSISEIADIRVENQSIVLCHYAMRVWNKSHHGRWMLYGHSHGTLPDDPNALSIDVGVDCHNFTPINIADISRIMKKKTFKPIDHHGK